MALRDAADVVIPELRDLQRKLLMAGGVGLAIALVGAFINLTQFLQSYLMAYMLCLGVTLGCLALGMVHQLSGGAWGVLIRRQVGAASRVIPVMTVLFLPIALGLAIGAVALFGYDDQNARVLLLLPFALAALAAGGAQLWQPHRQSATPAQ